MLATVEIVHFRLVADATKDEFLSANQEVTAWVQKQTGFISRQLCLNNENVWSDVVVWDSPQSAKIAANNFIEVLGPSDFMRMIEFSSVQMSHQAVLASC